MFLINAPVELSSQKLTPSIKSLSLLATAAF